MKLQLKALRKKESMTQQALADLLQVDIGTIGNWERGKTMMSIEQLCNCCEALGCTPNDMTGWSLEHPDPVGAATSADPMREELVRCYDASTDENRHSLVVAARNAALASGEAAERGADTEGVSA